MEVFTSRYARALADAVQSAHLDMQQTYDGLRVFGGLLTSNDGLRGALEGPSVSLESKLRVLDSLADRLHMGPVQRNFVAVLLQHERIGAFNEILAEYRREMDARSNVEEAEVISTRPLAPEERSALEAKAAALTQKNVRAVYRLDPALLGGTVLRIGATIYDGSLRGRLQRLREQLAEGQ
jgi:F-type H+-transporting ATPase subunit delta